MAMLAYNEVLPKKLVIIDGDPYEVVSAWVFRKQQRKPVNQAKLRNLKTGSMAEHTFHVADKIEEADIEARPAKFIFHKNGEWTFHEVADKSKRFVLTDDHIGENAKYMKSDMEVDVRWFEEKPIQVNIPIKVDLKVVEAPPNNRGNTAQGGNKPVKLETGAMITVPMFIEAGDVIRINTETGEYVERA